MIKNWETPKNAYLKPLREGRFTLLQAAEYAFSRCNPNRLFERFELKHLKKPLVISIGKAASSLFNSLSERIEIEEGVIVSNQPLNVTKIKVKTFLGGHPLPNKGSIKAGIYLVNKLKTITNSDIDFLFLISGGGSSMLELPKIPLKDLITTYKLLLNSGANIEEINTVRKHLSRIKGGQIIKYLNKKSEAFLMSDVIDDRIDLIASGLTTCDRTTYRDCFDILKKYNLWEQLPQSTRETIELGMQGKIEETFKDCELASQRIENHLMLTNSDFCNYFSRYLKNKGIETILLGSNFHNGIEEMSEYLKNKAFEIAGRTKNTIAILAGGEVGVKVTGKGKGGRNQELALRVALSLQNLDRDFVFLAIGTDGIDGITDAAGAISDNKTLGRAKQLGLNPQEFLVDNDSYNFFKKLNDLIFTGPTGINVKDVYCLLLI